MGFRRTLGVVVTSLGAVVACGTGDNAKGSEIPGTGGGTNTGGGVNVGGSANGTGNGGGINVGGSANGTGTGGDGGGGVCNSIGATATNQLQPADIVFALDDSGSMTEEAGFVQTHMNTFSSGIINANIDAHVVVLSNNQGEPNGVCIGAPLGSGSCPNDDNPPGFLHVDQDVQSNNALSLLLSRFDDYKSMFRTGASKHFIVVTDDDSSLDAASFDTQIKAKLLAYDPLFKDYKFHSIYGYTEPNVFDCLLGSNDPCCDGSDTFTASVGEVYKQLVAMKGGVQGNLCLQDFLPMFNQVSQQVAQSSGLACEWEIPPPPAGETFDKNKVNVQFSSGGGAPQDLGYVPSAADCAAAQGGWYYDDANNPTKIYVCPETCAVLQGVTDAKIDILFGCATKPAVPK
jgi:hypothetical protein